MDPFLIDGHNDLPWAHREAFGLDLKRGDLQQNQPSLHTDLPRLRAGRVKGQFWSVYVPSSLPGPKAVTKTLEQIDFVHRMVTHYPDLELAVNADQIEAAVDRGRIASMIGVEGGHAIAESLAVLRQFYELGARYLTLTHNDNTAWADAATDRRSVGGLSDFGATVVQELNRLGMMIDLAHVSDATMHDALDATAAPVIFSHSNARTRCSVPRNVPDDVLARVPANGGLVMATFVPSFVSPKVASWMNDALAARETGDRANVSSDMFMAMREYARTRPPPRATIEDVVSQLQYLREAVGVNHLGIGGDYDGNDWVTVGLEDVSCYPRLFDALRNVGWTSADIDALAGRNLLRVLREVEGNAVR